MLACPHAPGFFQLDLELPVSPGTTVFSEQITSASVFLPRPAVRPKAFDGLVVDCYKTRAETYGEIMIPCLLVLII